MLEKSNLLGIYGEGTEWFLSPFSITLSYKKMISFSYWQKMYLLPKSISVKGLLLMANAGRCSRVLWSHCFFSQWVLLHPCCIEGTVLVMIVIFDYLGDLIFQILKGQPLFQVPNLLQVVKRRRIKHNLSRKSIFFRDHHICQ